MTPKAKIQKVVLNRYFLMIDGLAYGAPFTTKEEAKIALNNYKARLAALEEKK